MEHKFKQPSIFYEESAEGLSAGFPFMQIEKDESIPNVLFVGAISDTGERFEEESSETVKELVMQSYYNSEAIKQALDEETYNKLKVMLGLRQG